ncbi:sel1 repeat family protein [Pseudoalteromonas sp. NZS11]|uniref:sel1 repeat family protein n=1 Tax=Pseudoalteromonas sp. NZS11 TaxID=2792049 RepID=UPI0018CCB665|nr:sel1 repeat family protein [Pseudoalteromonas sp. NZS11]MBH0078743.1 sel1 repeat family protein [Pseudoalteromonas sp. NZS11]
MKKFSVAAASMVFITLLGGCNSSPINLYSDTTMKKNEYNGIKAYRKGEFEAAFNYLKEPAGLGYKSAQYTLAFMFLKGQYLEQSTKLGMGWLGVAKEAGVENWSAQYDAFYSAATTQQKQLIDETVALYITQFGVKAQNMTCRSSTSPRRTFGEVKIDCTKHEGIVTEHDIQIIE